MTWEPGKEIVKITIVHMIYHDKTVVNWFICSYSSYAMNVCKKAQILA